MSARSRRREATPESNLRSFDRTRFVGRQAELRALNAALDDGAPLVTVVGTAGLGKTRLARRMAQSRMPAHPGGVWFVDLTAADSRDALLSTVADTLRVPLTRSGRVDASVHLGHALAARGPMLLVLDGFEHLVTVAGETLSVWLDLAPESQLLATSIVRLGVEGETVYELPPLAPEDAAQLYEERARRVRGDLAAPDPEMVQALMECLDHLPLAIELAAARAAVLSPKQLVGQVGRHLELLRGTRHGRHTSLAGAIGCTLDLLTGTERAALAQCAVFRGGFSMEAAERVLRIPGGDAAPAALDLLEALREKSLLRRDEDNPDRFALYETVRDFAERELLGPKEREALERRHRACFLELGEALAAQVFGGQGTTAIRRLAQDRENLVSAQLRSLDDHPEAAARLGLALEPLASRQGPPGFEVELLDRTLSAARRSEDRRLEGRALRARAAAHLKHGEAHEARKTIDAGLSVARRTEDEVLEAQLLVYSGRLRSFQGEVDAGRVELECAAALARGGDERHLEGQALNVLGGLEVSLGHLTEAAALFEAALDRFRTCGDLRFQGSATMNLGVVRTSEGRQEDARSLYEEALALLESADDRATATDVLVNLGSVQMIIGDLDAAERTLERALALERALGNRRFEGLALANLAIIAQERGNLRLARQRFHQALGVFRACDERRFHADTLPFFAAVEAALGLLDEARGDFSAARAALEELGDPGRLALLEVLEGFLDLGLAREAAQRLDLEASAACAEQARARLSVRPPQGARSEELPVAMRLLERALAERSTAPAASAPVDTPSRLDALVVAEGAEWFEAPGRGRVDISRRGSIRLVLQALVEQRLLAPGVGLDPERVFQLGWPGEKAQPLAAANRVYAAIRTLRALDLGDLLKRRDDGYLLDPAVRVVRLRH